MAVEVNDTDDVPKLVAAALQNDPSRSNWNTSTVKQKLTERAFPLMTAKLIDERDPNGEVKGWLRRISGMLH